MLIKVSAKGNHLVFVEAKFVDGLQDGEMQIGVLALENPAKAGETLAKAQKKKWKLVEPDPTTGLYKVVKA